MPEYKSISKIPDPSRKPNRPPNRDVIRTRKIPKNPYNEEGIEYYDPYEGKQYSQPPITTWEEYGYSIKKWSKEFEEQIKLANTKIGPEYEWEAMDEHEKIEYTLQRMGNLPEKNIMIGKREYSTKELHEMYGGIGNTIQKMGERLEKKIASIEARMKLRDGKDPEKKRIYFSLKPWAPDMLQGGKGAFTYTLQKWGEGLEKQLELVNERVEKQPPLSQI